jgi:eukaryotic-like serine/threonine-protein kinase
MQTYPRDPQSIRILVVDDDPVIREFVKLHLGSASFTVELAEDGEAGLVSALQAAPDLIISDISMPGMDGFQLLESIRAQAATAAIPFILLSQHGDVSVFRRGMELGADDFLAKPVKRQDLLNSVTARLMRAERARKRHITVQAAAKAPAVPELAQPVASRPGELEGYRLIRKLGEGGMSQVFLAEKADTGELRVLKLARLGDHDGGTLLQRFLSEYALVSQISHLNVAKIYHQGFSDTHAYIDMEYFPNGDLRAMLELNISPQLAIAILIQVASALSAVHAQGIVHRDMKPDNVMMRANGSLALADFGIAKHLHTELHYTAHGEVFGTPVYIAPEQATGQDVDARADIYSMGAMFFELLTGRSPYQARDAQSMLHQHVSAPLPVLPAHVASLSSLMNRLLAKRRADRPQTAHDVVRWLAAHEGIDISSEQSDNQGEEPATYLVEIIGFNALERILIASVLTLSAHRDIRFTLQSDTPKLADLFIVDADDANGRLLLEDPAGFGNVPVVALGARVGPRAESHLAKPVPLGLLLNTMENRIRRHP